MRALNELAASLERAWPGETIVVVKVHTVEGMVIADIGAAGIDLHNIHTGAVLFVENLSKMAERKRACCGTCAARADRFKAALSLLSENVTVVTVQ